MKEEMVLETGFVFKEKTQLTVRKTSLFFAGDGFIVYDCNGELVFRVDSYGPDGRDQEKMVLMDASGRCLLTVRRKRPSLHQRWEGYVGDKTEGQKRMFSVRRPSIIGRSSVTVEMYDKPGEEFSCQIYGSFGQRCCMFFNATKEPVGETKRKVDTSITELFSMMFMIFMLAKSTSGGTTNLVNVMRYGAVGDGKTDDSQAFIKAWKAVCQSQSRISILSVPSKRTFLLKPVNFVGPCKSSYTFVQVAGNLVGPKSKSDWRGYHIDTWLSFSHVNRLYISGVGRIDGSGPTWWPQPCMGNAPNGVKCNGPTAIKFNRCNGLVLKGFTLVNSPRNHITLSTCRNVLITNIHITSPETSPNTDGIGISGSTQVQIRNSVIETGDDCIAINGGSSKIDISGITCGPGHGISIGSLGVGGSTETVEDVHVRNCTLKGTLAGVRIKTWQGGKGYARRISYENIKFVGGFNPIIIDQFYCPSGINCKNMTSAVKISDVTYRGISGTSASENPIVLNCDQYAGCSNIVLDHVYITSSVPGKKLYSSCHNAHGRASHVKPTVNCLLK